MSYQRYIVSLCTLVFVQWSAAQVPKDFLSATFHKNRRAELRKKMPANSVAVIFSNTMRNRANDVDYVFHQDPNFYYLTGFREPNAVLMLFSDMQQDDAGQRYNELLYVPKKDPRYELWNGKRLGMKAAKKQLLFDRVRTTEQFLTDSWQFNRFKKILLFKFQDDYRNSMRSSVDLYDLVVHFKNSANYVGRRTLPTSKQQLYQLIRATPIENAASVAQYIGRKINEDATLAKDSLLVTYSTKEVAFQKEIRSKVRQMLAVQGNFDHQFLPRTMATMREIKRPEELTLLRKAIRISAMGQVEVMKAMKPNMSETEIQGIHEFVYKKYGAEYEGYPSIVGAGNNGCILHYIENSKTKVAGELVLMDLGAEYRGYTADVTRTIPASGKFSVEQKAIYELVLKAQNAGIAQCVAGNPFWKSGEVARAIINKGLFELGIIDHPDTKHQYFPHGTSHHIGLDVHDPGNYNNFEVNMVVTVEPGVYIPNGSPCDKKWWGIAVRIEDDILITKEGPVNLSDEAPRTVEAIEKLMRKESVLNQFKLPKL